MGQDRNRVCPVGCAWGLEIGLRRWLQNPQKILAPYVSAGMTVLDIGCGPGFFSIEMARLVGPAGRVHHDLKLHHPGRRHRRNHQWTVGQGGYSCGSWRHCAPVRTR